MRPPRPSQGTPADPHTPAPRRAGAVLAVVVAAWAGAAALGLVALSRYALTPGDPSGGAGARWPAGTAVPSPDGRPAVVVFVHPRCPCSRATLGELDAVLALDGRTPGRTPGRAAAVTVVLQRHRGAAGDWTRTGVREAAEAIPGVVVLEDAGGAEAAWFGARTSGATFAYDAAGRLAFRGGITVSRGHAGAGAGRDAVSAVLRGTPPAVVETPVYGCPLQGPGETECAPAPPGARDGAACAAGGTR